MTEPRTEFGWPRTECSCRTCRRNCMFMPGFLIPADLARIIPPDVDPFQWAESNLLASPGAMAMKDGKTFHIRTLVPATKDDGSCIHYRQRRCQIHAVSPFGCAFFDCGPERDHLSEQGLTQVLEAWLDDDALYAQIHNHLWKLGLRQEHVSVLRERMNNN
jgi:hypothetical protein